MHDNNRSLVLVTLHKEKWLACMHVEVIIGIARIKPMNTNEMMTAAMEWRNSASAERTTGTWYRPHTIYENDAP